MGSTTSVDVTREGVEKAYGLRRLSEESEWDCVGKDVFYW